MNPAFDITFAAPAGDPVRFLLRQGEERTVGRGPEADFVVEGDENLSRRHCRLRGGSDGVEFERLPEATNPLFHEGVDVPSCRVTDGGTAVLAATLATVSRHEADSESDAPPVEDVDFDPSYLKQLRFRDPGDRIEVLTRLPEVIWGAQSESEFRQRLANLVLAGVAHAEAVAIVAPRATVGESAEAAVEILHWERRRETAGTVRTSTRLVREAIGERRKSVLRVWEAPESREPGDDYTAVPEFDWAFCTPVLEGVQPWGIYVAGGMAGVDGPDGDGVTDVGAGRSRRLHGDVKFTELVAEIVLAVRKLNQLERRQAGLRQFFAPAVLSALAEDPGLLEPRECDVTVMFCDLRGFSREAEASRDDLFGLLDRVSHALGVMNREIQAQGGVTADYLGDAALGFWGWPLSSAEAPLAACRAALGIRRSFEEAQARVGHPLEGFRTGIGIARGRAVAGKIGTAEHVKITVFGPVVNLAARLEGLTKPMHVPILLDKSTADVVRERFGEDEGRVRRLGRVLPVGMERPVDLHELLGPEGAESELSTSQLRLYEEAVEDFVAGRWEEAVTKLAGIPPGDRAQDFLRRHIVAGNRTAPADWDGVVRIPDK